MRITGTKVLIFLFFVMTPFVVLAQERQILDWGFFKNDRPSNVEHQAFTWTYLGYNFKTVKVDGEKANIQFEVTFRLDTAKSYFDHTRKQLNDLKLLEHEQGHADITFIYAMKLKDSLSKTTFYLKTYNVEARKIFNKIYGDMREEQLRYDSETNHSRITYEQKKWNKYFRETVSSLIN